MVNVVLCDSALLRVDQFRFRGVIANVNTPPDEKCDMHYQAQMTGRMIDDYIQSLIDDGIIDSNGLPVRR